MDDDDIDILIETTKACHDRTLACFCTGHDVGDLTYPPRRAKFLVAKGFTSRRNDYYYAVVGVASNRASV